MLKSFFSFIAISVVLVSCNLTPENVSSSDDDKSNSNSQFKVEIHDSSALDLIAEDAKFEKLASGFYWSEGPLWVNEINSLIFSDVPRNKIFKWNENDSLSIFLEYSGHTGEDNLNSGRGSNGLIMDNNNNLIICQHGDMSVVRMLSNINDPKPEYYTIADSYNGKKFNSPNDLVMDKSGNIYFTDPPYGRPENKTGDIGINGVYLIGINGEVKLLVDSLSRPNGIGLSPDEKKLYINHSNPSKPFLYCYNINDDGTLSNGKILFNFTELSKNSNGLPDGLKVHSTGNIFATGPGGVHIISPDGKNLATLRTGKSTANCAFDSNEKYLYTTTTDMLLRIKLKKFIARPEFK